MLSESLVRAALRDCYDPTLPCNIVDLGLILALRITPDPDAPGANIPGVPERQRVHITLTLSAPTEAAEAQLAGQVQNRLAGLDAVSATEVLFDHTRPWSPADITPAGRRTLGLEGNPTLVQIR